MEAELCHGFEAVKLVRSTIPANILLSLEVEDRDGVVLAEPSQVHQIVLNLLTNAYHAVEATGGTISVRLEKIAECQRMSSAGTQGRGDRLRLSVADNGCGIDPKEREKIFEPYFTTKKQDKGTGLGLAVVYGIVKKWGGEIEVSSEMGKGTLVEVLLPRLACKAPAERVTAAVEIETGRERILLVDDEPSIAKLVTRMLERMGYQVEAMTSSSEALTVFRSKPGAYDLVIMDMAMPRMTGDRLARELIAIRPEIPIVLCTGFSDRIDEQQAAELGVKALLLKPVRKRELAALIRRLLDGKSRPKGATNAGLYTEKCN